MCLQSNLSVNRHKDRTDFPVDVLSIRPGHATNHWFRPTAISLFYLTMTSLGETQRVYKTIPLVKTTCRKAQTIEIVSSVGDEVVVRVLDEACLLHCKSRGPTAYVTPNRKSTRLK
jgi:hypothetical protein